jgi:hypothetical protein
VIDSIPIDRSSLSLTSSTHDGVPSSLRRSVAVRRR